MVSPGRESVLGITICCLDVTIGFLGFNVWCEYRRVLIHIYMDLLYICIYVYLCMYIP